LLEDIEKEVLEKTFENLKILDTESNSISSCLNIIVDWINNDFNIKPHKLAEIIYHICNNIVG
jgi:hypothetical protein